VQRWAARRVRTGCGCAPRPARRSSPSAATISRHDGARCYALAVQPVAVAHTRLNRVAEGMPEVQQARSPLSRSSAATTSAYSDSCARWHIAIFRIARQQLVHVLLQPFKKRKSRIRPYLMTSAMPAASSFRQGIQRIRIGQALTAAGNRRSYFYRADD